MSDFNSESILNKSTSLDLQRIIDQIKTGEIGIASYGLDQMSAPNVRIEIFELRLTLQSRKSGE